MKKIIKYSLIAFGVFFLISCLLIFRPVPIVTEHKTIAETGIVTNIYDTKGYDIVFVLEHTKRRFYINRGLQRGLELKNLREQLIGNPIVVKYPKYWTPLDWHNSVKHISKVEFKDEVVFNELLPQTE